MMPVKKDVAFDYEPRAQFMALHKRTERWACMVCHRRAGKTVAAIHELVLRALYTPKKNARYAYVAPFYRQAKDVAWVYLKEATKSFAVRIRESALRVELPNGAWITLYGADNPDALRGIYLDGIILDEFGDARPSLWGTVILPTLADRKGWAVFIGTPKGKNHFYEIHKRSQEETGWYSLTLKASVSGIIDAEELLEMKAQMTDEAYEQEMECSFTAAIVGTYYASMIEKMELNKQISTGVCVYDRSLPVKVAMDLGRTDNTAAWFWQETPNGINIIDYYEAQGKVLDHYIAMLNAKGYNYEEVWLPHDAVAKTLATKRSTIEQLLEAGFPCRKVPKLEVQHGIDAARKVLPHCVIDQEKCFAGVEALRAYRRSYNELLKQYNDKPLHDWSSDGADAFRYLSLVCKERVRNEVPENFRKKEAGNDVYDFSLDDLFKERDTFKQKQILRI
jgi:phage terminase large subunit